MVLMLDDLYWTFGRLLDEYSPFRGQLSIMQAPQLIHLRTRGGGLNSFKIEILDGLGDFRWLAPFCAALPSRRLSLKFEFTNVVAPPPQHRGYESVGKSRPWHVADMRSHTFEVFTLED